MVEVDASDQSGRRAILRHQVAVRFIHLFPPKIAVPVVSALRVGFHVPVPSSENDRCGVTGIAPAAKIKQQHHDQENHQARADSYPELWHVSSAPNVEPTEPPPMMTTWASSDPDGGDAP